LKPLKLKRFVLRVRTLEFATMTIPNQPFNDGYAYPQRGEWRVATVVVWNHFQRWSEISSTVVDVAYVFTFFFLLILNHYLCSMDITWL